MKRLSLLTRGVKSNYQKRPRAKSLMEVYSRSTTHKSIQGFFLVFIDFLAISGNIIVCWVVFRKRKTLRVPYLYVFALAVSDLTVAICCFPLCIQAFFENVWAHGHILCQFTGFLIYFWAGISVPTLALTAVNRYFRVCKYIATTFRWSQASSWSCLYGYLRFVMVSYRPSLDQWYINTIRDFSSALEHSPAKSTD